MATRRTAHVPTIVGSVVIVGGLKPNFSTLVLSGSGGMVAARL